MPFVDSIWDLDALVAMAPHLPHNQLKATFEHIVVYSNAYESDRDVHPILREIDFGDPSALTLIGLRTSCGSGAMTRDGHKTCSDGSMGLKVSC